MKKALLVPFRYLLSLLLLTICICGYVILVNSARYQGLEGNDGQFLFDLINGLEFSFFLGGILSVLLLIASILRMETQRGTALLLLFLIAAPSFFFGYYGLRQLEETNFGDRVVTGNPLAEKNILQFSGGAFYFLETRTDALESMVLYHYGNVLENPFDERDTSYELVKLEANQQKVSFIDTVPYSAGSEELLISSRSAYTLDGKELLIEASAIENTRENLFSQFALPLSPVFEDILATLDNYAETISLHYFALIIALFLFIFSTLLFLRMTRWPLINMILTLLVNLGGLWLTRIHEISEVRDFAARFLPERAVVYIAPSFLGVFALLFVIINAFLPSLTDWSREINS